MSNQLAVNVSDDHQPEERDVVMTLKRVDDELDVERVVLCKIGCATLFQPILEAVVNPGYGMAK